MMTPDSIASKHFDKAMGGFRQDEVEAFLKEVSDEFRLLQAEKLELEKKIEVLASKIEQYREDEDSLRSALIGAQKLGDSVIRESKAKAEVIVREANGQAAKILEDVQGQIQIEQAALVTMKKEVTKFKNRLLGMYRQHLDLITSLPEYPNPELSAVDTVLPTEDPAPVEEVPEAAPAEEVADVQLDFSAMDNEDTSAAAMSFSEIPTPSAEVSSKFGQLKFGEGFDVEREDSKKNGVFSRKKHHSV